MCLDLILKNRLKFIISLEEYTNTSLCDFSDAFILVTGDITVNAGNDTHAAFKNCAPFSTCKK